MKIKALKAGGCKINLNASEHTALSLLVERGRAGLDDPKVLKAWSDAKWPPGIKRGFTSSKLLEPGSLDIPVGEAEE